MKFDQFSIKNQLKNCLKNTKMDSRLLCGWGHIRHAEADSRLWTENSRVNRFDIHIYIYSTRVNEEYRE